MLGFRQKPLETKSEDQSNDLVSAIKGWVHSWGRPTSSGINVSAEKALGVASIFAAVRVISDAIASVPINLIEEIPSADGQITAASRIIRTHWAAKLMERPEKRRSGRDLKKWMGACLAIHAECAMLKIRAGGGIRYLKPIPNGSWGRVNANDPETKIWVNLAGGTRKEFLRDDVVIITLFSLDGQTAISPVMCAAEAIGLTMSLETQQSSMARNGGRFAGFFTAAEGADEAEVINVKEGYKDSIAVGGEGSTPILPDGWQHHKIAFSSSEQQILQSREFQVLEIARVFGIPAYMIEGGNASSYASSHVATRVFVQHAISPYLVAIEEALTIELLRDEKYEKACENLRYDADERALLRGSPEVQAQYYATALGAGGQGGWLTPNEVRDEQGRPRINEPWADTISRGAMDPTARQTASDVADTPPGLQLPGEEEKNPDA